VIDGAPVRAILRHRPQSWRFTIFHERTK
jgi:hypothetical protein